MFCVGPGIWLEKWEYVENDTHTHTLQDLAYGEKTENRGK